MTSASAALDCAERSRQHSQRDSIVPRASVVRDKEERYGWVRVLLQRDYYLPSVCHRPKLPGFVLLSLVVTLMGPYGNPRRNPITVAHEGREMTTFWYGLRTSKACAW